jgi:hypothetical protein
MMLHGSGGKDERGEEEAGMAVSRTVFQSFVSRRVLRGGVRRKEETTTRLCAALPRVGESGQHKKQQEQNGEKKKQEGQCLEHGFRRIENE